MTDVWPRRGLRAMGVVIALLAAVDPSVTSNRSTKPEISVVAADSVADAALLGQVKKQLSSTAVVMPAFFTGAAGTVMVGNHLPPNAQELTTPVFAVIPERSGAVVNIETVRAPSSAPFSARVPVATGLRVTGARSRNVDVILRVNGVAVDRISHAITTDDARFNVPLSFVPTARGAQLLRISAAVGDASQSTHQDADVVVNLSDRQWTVLFFDPRPSWMSTFVRRAIEQDARFVVTSRVNTSTNISTDEGRPPATLNDASAIESFDAVVVGAPDALTDRDVDGLETFLRKRGGGVVLLFDQKANGTYERLVDAGAWNSSGNSVPVAVRDIYNDSAALRVSEWMIPSRLPEGADVLAWRVTNARDSLAAPSAAPSRTQALVWKTMVGAGRLVTSSALDAWRFRDASRSGFESFWRTTLADVASASPAAMEIAMDNTPFAPNAERDVTVTLRSAALATRTSNQSVHARVSAVMTSANGLASGVTSGIASDSMGGLAKGTTNVRFWPTGSEGQFRGRVRAPNAPGVYRLVVSSEGVRDSATVTVASAPANTNPDDRDFIAAWTAPKGGRVFAESRLSDLGDALTGALTLEPHRVSWHPMRSPWWIVPFALALAGEWWLRRRRGLA